MAVISVLDKADSEQYIPLEPTANQELFYSLANIRHLEKVARRIEDGTANLVEHELIEVIEAEDV